jgi:hypothetical protein
MQRNSNAVCGNCPYFVSTILLRGVCVVESPTKLLRIGDSWPEDFEEIFPATAFALVCARHPNFSN